MSQSELFSPEDIVIIQTRQLRKTIHYLYTRSPFYRDRFDQSGVAPAEIKTLDDLRLVPTTAALDLQQAPDRFLCVRPEEVADLVTTSGTTAAPTLFKLTESDLARLAYAEQLSFRVVELAETDVVALAVTLDRGFLGGLAYYLGLRRLGATTLRVGPVDPAALLDLLVQARVTTLVADPAYLVRVARYAEHNGFPLGESAVRKLVCIGEPVRTPEFELNAVGRYLSEAWQARCFSSFGATELAGSLCECPAGKGGHLHPELMHAEIVDDQGQPLPAGQVGELCVTPFGVTGMPVLRYRTGDLASLQSDLCPCGRFTLRLGPVLGRRRQQLRLAGRERSPLPCHQLLQADPDVLTHWIIAETGPDGQDRMRVLLDLKRPEALERLRQRLRAELELEPELRAVQREERDALHGENDYRKQQWFLDHRQAPSTSS